MSIEIIIPFQLDDEGGIATTPDPNRQASQHISALLSTSPGERVMTPTYGVPVKGSVFAPDDDTVVADVTQQITAAAAKWEPNINIRAVDVSIAVGDPTGMGTIEVDWDLNTQQTGSSSGVSSVAILIGGQVVES